MPILLLIGAQQYAHLAANWCTAACTNTIPSIMMPKGLTRAVVCRTVVPKGSFEYIAGNAFAATFDVCPRVSKGYATIAIKQRYLHAYGVMPHRPWWSYKYGNAWVATQKLPLYWKGRMMNIRVKDDGR